MMNEFPARNWSKNNLNRLIRQIDASASSKRKSVTGRPRSARTADNIARVAELICSQEDNPVDYSIWGALQQWLYRERIVNVEHLKRVITRCWTEISQELINGAIDQWARRIDSVIRARGRHIEYLFD